MQTSPNPSSCGIELDLSSTSASQGRKWLGRSLSSAELLDGNMSLIVTAQFVRPHCRKGMAVMANDIRSHS